MITSVEIDLLNNEQLDISPLIGNTPCRILVTILNDEDPMEQSMAGEGRSLDVFEGVYDLSRNVLLLEESFLLGPKRAIVVVLDEPPKSLETDLRPTDHAMEIPVEVGNIVFDLTDAAEISDEGDHIYINFGFPHQPPFMVLEDEAAEQLRTTGLPVYTTDHQYLSEPELSAIADKYRRGEEVNQEFVLRLVEDVRALRKSRRGLLNTAASYLQMHLDHCGGIALDKAENRIRKVKCTKSDQCKVLADGSCSCDEPFL